MRAKLCYLTGFVQSILPSQACEWPDLAQLTDDQILDCVIRMLDKARDAQLAMLVSQAYRA